MEWLFWTVVGMGVAGGFLILVAVGLIAFIAWQVNCIEKPRRRWWR